MALWLMHGAEDRFQERKRGKMRVCICKYGVGNAKGFMFFRSDVEEIEETRTLREVGCTSSSGLENKLWSCSFLKVMPCSTDSNGAGRGRGDLHRIPPCENFLYSFLPQSPFMCEAGPDGYVCSRLVALFNFFFFKLSYKKC